MLVYMQVTLTAQAQEALRRELARSPGREPEQIVEEALTEMAQRQAVRHANTLSSQDFDAWLRESRQGIEPAPDLIDETFRGRRRHCITCLRPQTVALRPACDAHRQFNVCATQ